MRALLALLLVFPIAALADGSNVVIQHSGYLLDVADQPVDGTVAMTFAIYASEAATVATWQESYAVAVTHGTYAIALGDTRDQKAPIAATDAAGDVYLGISVGPLELLPRLRLGAVPTAASALIANDSHALGGVAAAAYALRTDLPTVTNGLNAALATAIEPMGSNCASGGTKVTFGTDVNGNGVLDSGEVNASLTRFVCQGAQGLAGAQGGQGAQGTQGAAGTNGLTALVATATEAPGANCTPGGLKVTAGVDANGNGALDAGEVTQTRYVCHGAAAAASVPAGFIGHFNLTVCPAGWTELTAARGRYLVGLPLGGTLAATNGTPLTNLEDRPVGSHAHGLTDPGHAHGVSDPGHWHFASQAFHNHTVSIGVSYGASGAYGNRTLGDFSGFPEGAATGTFTTTGQAPAVTVFGSYTGVGVYPAATGATVDSAGSVVGTPAPYLQVLTCQKS